MHKMRLRNIKGSREKIAASKYIISDGRGERTSFNERTEASVKGRWNEVFGNANPIYIEIGMGKGAFIMEQARLNPDINFVGIEKFSSVLLRAVQKQDEENLPNVRFMRTEAEIIEDIFAPGEVDKIYLNFSDPWPKASQAQRRLPSSRFLGRYQKILKDKGLIEFKTDNKELFDFALEEIPIANEKAALSCQGNCCRETWHLLAKTYDLSGDPLLSKGNVMTEYETRFSAQGKPICKYILELNL